MTTMPYSSIYPWGVLSSCSTLLTGVRLCKDLYNFGTTHLDETCIDLSSLGKSISKKHFTISHDLKSKCVKSVLITAHSADSIYVNGEVVGMGESKILATNDTIAVSDPKKIYTNLPITNTQPLALIFRR